MDVRTYQEKVIHLFQYGRPTDEMFAEMGRAVLDRSESCADMQHIDSAIGVDDEEN
jgi:hypothetical protein